MSIEFFWRLVKLVVRVFYDEEIFVKGFNWSKFDKFDNKGIVVVVFDVFIRLCIELYYI